LETIVIFLLPVGFFLAIQGFQMFEARVYLRRGILLTVTLALLVSAGYMIVLSAQLLFPNAVSSVWSFAIVCIVLGVILWPAIRNLSALVDTLFFPERVVSRQLTKEIIDHVAEYTEIQVLCKVFADHVAQGLGANSVAVYVVNENGTSFDLAGAAGEEKHPARIDGDVALRAVSEEKSTLGAWEHVLAISFRQRTNALLCLGKKNTGERLSLPELDELKLASRNGSCGKNAQRSCFACYTFQDDEGLQVTVSIGTATSREGVASAELLTHSDQALYSAKRSGKNRVHLHGV
jgi:predicted signal transduction protein with EAL and GGDEF domain